MTRFIRFAYTNSGNTALIINTNLNCADLKKAFKIGTKKLGYNINTDRDYTDNFIFDGWSHFVKNGLIDNFKGFTGKIPNSENDLTENFDFDFVGLHLFVCKFGNPNFEFEIVEKSTKTENVIFIG